MSGITKDFSCFCIFLPVMNKVDCLTWVGDFSSSLKLMLARDDVVVLKKALLRVRLLMGLCWKLVWDML